MCVAGVWDVVCCGVDVAVEVGCGVVGVGVDDVVGGDVAVVVGVVGCAVVLVCYTMMVVLHMYGFKWIC